MAAIGRVEINIPLPDLDGATVLVTGSDGFIGSRIVDLLRGRGAVPLACDRPVASVLKPYTLPRYIDYCLHLAAHKYATSAEDSPAEVTELNVRGTANMIDRYGDRVVLASTCKAADPMTVYGASKLIAERIALNAGARVVRFVNVLGSTGSVAEMWADTPEDEPIKVAPCKRMWMSDREAVRLMIAALGWPTGRYALDVPEPEPVEWTARRLHPARPVERIPRRRGDRLCERLIAESEFAEQFMPGVIRINHPADQVKPSD